MMVQGAKLRLSDDLLQLRIFFQCFHRDLISHVNQLLLAVAIFPCGFVVVIACVATFLWKKRSEEDLEEAGEVPTVRTKRDKTVATLFSIAIAVNLVFMPAALEEMFTMFSCTAIDGELYNLLHFDQSCTSGGHLVLTLVVAVPLLGFALGFIPWKLHRLTYHSIKSFLDGRVVSGSSDNSPRNAELFSTQAYGIHHLPFEAIIPRPLTLLT